MTGRTSKLLYLFLFSGNLLINVSASEAGGSPINVRIDLPLSVTENENVGDDGSVVSIIGEGQIEKLDAKELTTALRRVPGVNISRFNPLGSYGGGDGGSIFIRGQGSGRPGSEVRIYSNGGPMESGVWVHPLIDTVPVDYSDSITVYKGPQPQTYSGTFGAVNIDTLRKKEEGFETQIKTGYGEYDTILGSVTHGGKINGFDYYLGASHKESEGNRPHSDAELNSGYLRLGYDVSEVNHLSYVLQGTDNWSRDPGRIDLPKPIRDRFDTDTTLQVLRIDTKGQAMNGFSLLYQENGKIKWAKDNINGSGTPPGFSNTDWDNYGFRASYDFPADRFIFTEAIDVESKGGESKNRTLSGYVPFRFDGRFTTIAPYTGIRYSADLGDIKVIPSAGLRCYKNSEFDSESAPCVSLSAEKDKTKCFILYARGVNYPGVYAKGISADTLHQMDAELIDNTEAGVQWNALEKVRLEASVFHYESLHHLQYTAYGLLNVGEMKTNGFETSIHFIPMKNLSLFLGLTLLDPDTDPAPRMPESTLSAGMTCHIMKYLTLDIDGEWVSSQYAYNGRTGMPSPADLEKLDSYFVGSSRLALDLAAVSRFNGELYFSVENFTDEDYEFLPGYPMAGRNVSSGLKLKF